MEEINRENIVRLTYTYTSEKEYYDHFDYMKSIGWNWISMSGSLPFETEYELIK